jgi:hypothetical protein
MAPSSVPTEDHPNASVIRQERPAQSMMSLTEHTPSPSTRRNDPDPDTTSPAIDFDPNARSSSSQALPLSQRPEATHGRPFNAPFGQNTQPAVAAPQNTEREVRVDQTHPSDAFRSRTSPSDNPLDFERRDFLNLFSSVAEPDTSMLAHHRRSSNPPSLPSGPSSAPTHSVVPGVWKKRDIITLDGRGISSDTSQLLDSAEFLRTLREPGAGYDAQRDWSLFPVCTSISQVRDHPDL